MAQENYLRFRTVFDHIISVEQDPQDKIFKLYQLLELIAEELTSDVEVTFKTLFSRLSFLGKREQVPPKLIRAIHASRIAYERRSYKPTNALEISLLGEMVTDLFIQTLEDKPEVSYNLLEEFNYLII